MINAKREREMISLFSRNLSIERSSSFLFLPLVTRVILKYRFLSLPVSKRISSFERELNSSWIVIRSERRKGLDRRFVKKREIVLDLELDPRISLIIKQRSNVERS